MLLTVLVWTAACGGDGWDFDANFDSRWGSGFECNIDRRPGLTKEDFEATYRHRKPVIFRNQVCNIKTAESLSRATLEKLWGDVPVRSALDHNHLMTLGELGVNMTLQAFLDTVMQEGSPNLDGTTKSPPYIFDNYRGDFLKACKERTGSTPFDKYTPPGITSWSSPLQIAIGNSNSGTQFHEHAEAFHELFNGKKRWGIVPPGKRNLVFNPKSSYSHWLEDVYPTLSLESTLLECIQEAGEVIYIPGGFMHATVNIGMVVGVASQSKDSKLGSAYHHFVRAMKTSSNRESLEELHRAILKKPNEANYWLHFGLHLLYDDALEEALGAFIKAIDLNPLLGEAYHKVASVCNLLGPHRWPRAVEMIQQAVERGLLEEDFIIVLEDTRDLYRNDGEVHQAEKIDELVTLLWEHHETLAQVAGSISITQHSDHTEL